MSTITDAIAPMVSRSATTTRFRPTLRRRATSQQIGQVHELLRRHPRAPAAAPLCPGGVLDDGLLRSWPRSAVAWLIYEIEVAPYNQ